MSVGQGDGGPTGPDAVAYERRGAAALITIDRPHRRNAVDGPTAEALLEAYRRFESDEDARVLHEHIRDVAGPWPNDGSIGPHSQPQPACASVLRD